MGQSKVNKQLTCGKGREFERTDPRPLPKSQSPFYLTLTQVVLVLQAKKYLFLLCISTKIDCGALLGVLSLLLNPRVAILFTKLGILHFGDLCTDYRVR